MKEWQHELLGQACVALSVFVALFFAVPSLSMKSTLWLSVSIPVAGWASYQLICLILYALGFEVE